MEFSKFLKYRVDISRNLRLIDFSGFFRFRFRVKVIYFKVFLPIIKGSKQKFKVILIDNHLI